MEEIWCPVVGWEGWYSVSDHGRVRRERPGSHTHTGKVLVGWPIEGYPAVRLHRAGGMLGGVYHRPQHTIYKIHRLVTAAFIGPCPRGREVNHIDADRTNNHLSNLEYVTRSQNMAHIYRLGRRKHHGENAPNAWFTWDMIRWIRKIYGLVTQRELGVFFDVHRGYIGQIQRYEVWQEGRD